MSLWQQFGGIYVLKQSLLGVFGFLSQNKGTLSHFTRNESLTQIIVLHS